MRRLLFLGALALVAACGDRWSAPAPGLVLAPSGAATTEAGGTATVRVSLAMAPSAGVTLDVVSTDSTEGAVVDPSTGQPAAWATLQFTPDDWSVPQSVTVVGMDDDARDGDVTWALSFAVSSSADAGYAALGVANVPFSNRDDDTPGIVLSRETLSTWEVGSTADVFTVALASRPNGTVTIPVTSERPAEVQLRGEASLGVTLARVDLVFTPSSWSAPQAVTVVGMPDGTSDGDQTFAVTVGPAAGDPAFAALATRSVTVTNHDVAQGGGFTVPAFGAAVPEGSLGSFCVQLTSTPAADVSLTVRSGDAAEGLLSTETSSGPFTASATLTIGAGTTGGCVWIMGQRDDVVDGTRYYAIAVGPSSSADAAFDGLPPQLVEVVSYDVDSPGVSIGPYIFDVAEGGPTATLTVWLGSRPGAEVTVPVRVDLPAEALISTAGGPFVPSLALLFTPADWAPREVLVQAVDDAIYEPGGAHGFYVLLDPAVSLDVHYDGLWGGANGSYGYVTDNDAFSPPPP